VSERLLVALAETGSVAAELRRVPLPGRLTRRGVRLAPCVRRVLAATTDPRAARSACAQAAWRLRASGASADAADALIAAGQLLAAEAPAAEAATTGAEGARVLDWLRVLDPGAARRRPPLREAQLRPLHRAADDAAVAALVRAMRADGELVGLLANGEAAGAWAVTSLVRAGHAMDALALLGDSDEQIWEPAAWALTVLCNPDPTSPPLDVGAAAMLPPLACLVADALLSRARPADAAALLALAEPHDPAVRLERARHAIALGDVTGARTLSVGGNGSFPAERAAALDCELTVAEGEPDQALALLPKARASAERAGDLVTARVDLAVVEGHAHWLRGDPRRGVSALTAARSWAGSRGLRATVEWIDLWIAGATVAAGSAPTVRARVERTLADMARAKRQLGRPFESIVLAEACWQEGDEAAHDAAIDDAIRLALQHGGRLMLRAPARLLPDPLARRDRASANPGLQRRLLDIAIATADGSPPPGARPAVVRLRTLGRAGLEALPDGRPLAAGHGVLELLAYLLSRGEAACVEDVLEDVLPSSTGWEMILRRQAVPPSPSSWNRSPRRRPWFRVVIVPMTQQEART
jgi:hypothetical protein